MEWGEVMVLELGPVGFCQIRNCDFLW